MWAAAKPFMCRNTIYGFLWAEFIFSNVLGQPAVAMSKGMLSVRKLLHPLMYHCRDF